MIIEVNMKQTRTITLRIPKELNDLVEKIVTNGKYVSKSDFIRAAVEEFLAEFEAKHSELIHEKGDGKRSVERGSRRGSSLVVIY